MKPVTVKLIRFSDLEGAPNKAELFTEYEAECAISELRPIDPVWPLYELLEDSGAAKLIGAFHGETLVGFLALLISPIPHFGKLQAATESFFVASEYRNTGAGIKLRQEAERIAMNRGVIGLFISAPVGSRLAEVLEADKAYQETNRVFFRGLQ